MNRAGRARDPSGRGDWGPLEHWGSRAPCGLTHYIWGPPVTPATALPSASDLPVQRDCLDGLRAKLQVRGRGADVGGRGQACESGVWSLPSPRQPAFVCGLEQQERLGSPGTG